MSAELSQCPFIVKLWQMLAEDSTFHGLAWGEGGESFHVRGSKSAISKMLARYFRHNEYSSFQRQLNYFGFIKIKLGSTTWGLCYTPTPIFAFIALRMCGI